jgi:hypothetical protein
MGYDVHITRRAFWADAADAISKEEWLAIVENDPELQFHPENGPVFAVWHDLDSPEASWLDWHDGNIYSKNPDDALLEKMKQIARKLGARVQGDDGEFY